MGFLTEAIERARSDLRRRERPGREGSLLLHARSLPPPKDFEAALRAPGTGIIAEIKRSSPSAGAISEADPGAQAERYERGGAAAISILTEARHFGGSLADLRLVRNRTVLPILCKDFIVHPVQVLEARAEGADAVLLIAAALSESEIRELAIVAHEVGLATLVEAHSEADLAKAVAAGAGILGVNSRDLETLQVDVERALALLASAPPDRVRVLESGVSSRHQVLAAADAGADAVLVGEAVMRAPDPVAKIAELLGR